MTRKQRRLVVIGGAGGVLAFADTDVPAAFAGRDKPG